MRWYNGNLTETDLLNHYTGKSKLGDNLSEIGGKTIAWGYAHYTESGALPAYPITGREDCNVIFLYMANGKTLALPMDDGYAGRADARNHPALKQMETLE